MDFAVPAPVSHRKISLEALSRSLRPGEPMGGPAGRPLRPEADHHLGDLALRSNETCFAAALGLYRQISGSAEQMRHCAAIVGAEEESIVTGPDAIRTPEATLAVKRAGETVSSRIFDSETESDEAAAP
jgi:hypothetical protein